MRRIFNEWIFYVICWVVITEFYTFVYLSMTWSFIEFLDFKEQIHSDPMLSYMFSNYQYLEGLLFGLLFGTATFGINLAVDRTSIHQLSFGKTIIIKTLLYFLAIAVIFVMMAGIIINSGISPITAQEYQDFLYSASMPASFWLGTASFFIASTLLVNFIALVSKKFGPGHLFLIFLGRYNRPITESRIFMFLDLKDSTTIAERLGHIIYSKLLQQCFLDMNKLIPNSGAEIYQYVGDEVVLTWKIRNRKSTFVKPVELYFSFKERLEKKSKYYNSKFGVVPEFKAGINAGVVTVAEIGALKREIAYHGDVVNTASRLRTACSEFHINLLASEYVIQNIPDSGEYNINEIGEVNLKGKTKSIKVYSIE